MTSKGQTLKILIGLTSAQKFCTLRLQKWPIKWHDNFLSCLMQLKFFLKSPERRWLVHKHKSHHVKRTVLANRKPLWPSSNQKLPSFSHAPYELVSAVVDLSNMTSIASQQLTSEGLTLNLFYSN